MTTVLVTGGTGYLGQEILAQLRAVGVLAKSVGRSIGNDIRCDLLDSIATSKLVADHREAWIIHCAAAVPKSSAGYRSLEVAQQGLAMTKNLALARPERVLFTSSMTVYADDIGLAEEEGVKTTQPGYGLAKLQSEAIWMQADMTTIVLRLPGLFGSGRRSGLLYNVAASLASGQQPRLAPVLPQWAAMDVRDAAAMCIRALQSNISRSVIINVGYSESMSIGDAVRRLARLFDMPFSSIQSPAFAFDLTRMHALLGAAPGDFQTRLCELVEWVRQDQEAEGHARKG